MILGRMCEAGLRVVNIRVIEGVTVKTESSLGFGELGVSIG